MQRFHTEERRRHGGAVALLALLALLAAGVVAPTGAAAQSRQPVLARAASTQLPAGELIFRFLDLTVPAGQPAVASTPTGPALPMRRRGRTS